MDADFDRSTACKLVADADAISVHTVTDTVNGETKDFTEFVIPISEMNTIELTTWLGNERMKSGLTGELVGYDSGGNAVFVLQIEDFSVRNRVSGPDAPTAVDEGFVTRTIAEQMIQSAVSSSAATKQDKLNAFNGGIGISVTSDGVISTENVPQSAVSGLSAALVGKQAKLNASNGGTGISVSNAGVISVSDVPQSAVTGLTTSLADISSSLTGKQDILTAGYRMEIVSGATVAQAKWFPITNVTGASVTMQPGEAYKIHATNSAVTINTISIPANQYGLESHLELFVAGTGYVVTGSNVVLANALEPDAVNNCTVRFHDGYAIISVEDHVAGYIVTVNAASGAGSLNYGLATSTNEYIAVDASLNGQTFDLGGATTNGEKHVVGNGYTETIVSGGINCTSKTTFANLGMDGVVVSSGTLTLGDVYIPNGATVAVSGGGLAMEKVTGDGGVVNLGGSNYIAPASGAVITGIGFTNQARVAGYGALYIFNKPVTISGCSFSDCSDAVVFQYAATYDLVVDCQFINNTRYDVFYGGGGDINSAAQLQSCYFSASATKTGAISIWNDSVVELTGCTFAGPYDKIDGNLGGKIILNGYNKTAATMAVLSDSATVTILSGAIVDLTGNTNATPIAPGGGITFEQGGATVYPSAGSAAAYSMDNVSLTSGAKLTNTNAVDFGGSGPQTISAAVASASGCSFQNGSAYICGGFYVVGGATASFTSCTFSNCSATNGGGAIDIRNSGTHVSLDKCSFVNCSGQVGDAIELGNRGASVDIKDCSFDIAMVNGTATLTGSNTFDLLLEYSTTNYATVYVTSGAVIDLTGTTHNPAIKATGGVIVYGTDDYSSQTTIIGSAGSATESRGFSARCTITGSAVTKIGAISGATVSLPSSSCQLDIIKSGESVVSTVYMQASESPYVVETQQGAGAVLVRVSED